MSRRHDKSPFDDAAIREMAHAFAVALMRPKDTKTTRFDPSMKLDTSQVKDVRSTPKSKKLMRWMITHNVNPSDITDRRYGRPAPRFDPRLGAAGQHNAEDAKRRMKAAGQRGAFDSDGRVERPAPAPTPEGRVKRGYAGTAPTQPVKRKRPKPKPRFNQGRHDA